MTCQQSRPAPRDSRISRRCTIFALVLSVLLLATPPIGVLASAGDLDKSFGSKGKVITGFLRADAAATSVVVQQDGKIVAGGGLTIADSDTADTFCMARYNP